MKLFFRTKENGASVFRVGEDPRQQRIDLSPVAEVNSRNGNVKLRAGATLTAAETSEIDSWIAARQARDAAREAATPETAIEAIHAAAHWVSGQPDPAVADQSIEDLLLAMLDLRSAIVRYKSKRTQDNPT